ncbi:MAG: hypothetical protein JRN06_00250 [Nitrososphaerota archaeon]|nr:hypothetical protein [Nitrososphaerota archaeon]MDG7023717.1 hypothetical protein [Nitrososphaerota archaeon]
MNSAEVLVLYLPVAYWGAFILLLYRHDLSRLLNPFRDQNGLRGWWSVLLSLGLLSPEQAALKPGGRGQALPYAAYLIVGGGLSLAWIIPAFPHDWYYLLGIQAASGVVFVMATVKHLGPPPRRPYVDVLRYPRLGSRVRHLQPPPQPTPTPPTKSDPKSKPRIRFFNVSLKNGTVVSTPSYTEKQAFVATLIHVLEAANPDFAWIQFLFVKSNHGPAFVRLKNSLRTAKAEMERPSLDFVSGEDRPKRELKRDFYDRAESRMNKVDEMVTKPLVTLAVQGMWVGSESNQVSVLPFDHCSDEHDSLAVFQYRDPRMLRELVDRRMVADIREYLDRYIRSRLEPPSFMVTPEGLGSLVHLPAGEIVESLHSVAWGNSSRGYTRAKIGDDAKADSGLRDDITSKVVRLTQVPKMEEVLEDVSVQPLDHLSSTAVRTFELVYRSGHTEFVLSAENVDDMRKYAGLLDSVYGDLNLETADQTPPFLRQLTAVMLAL